MPPKFLITGAAGFIGSNLVEALLEKGAEIRGLDNFATGRAENIEPFRQKIDFIEGSIIDPETCREAAAGVDYVLHQAAVPSVPRSIADPVTSHAANVYGLLNMLIAAKDEGVKRFVFASSSSVYGDTPVLPKHEDMPINVLSPYAATKAAGEHYLKSFFHAFGLPTVALRYFNVFGKRQDPGSQYSAVLPLFISRIIRGDEVLVHGDGEQSRDFTHVSNVVAANLAACHAPVEACGRAYNIACGARTTLNQVLAMLKEKLAVSFSVKNGPSRPGDVRHSHADIKAAEEMLGYSPGTSFEQGLDLTVDWYKNNIEKQNV